MSAVYQEGPFRRWVEVQFEEAEYTVTVVHVPANGIFILQSNLVVSDPQTLRGVFTGVDSGATLDTSLLPATTTQNITTATPTACVSSYTNYWNLNGTAFTTAPGIGWSIAKIAPAAGYSVQGNSQSSFTYNSGTGACDFDLNAPTFPAFINGEKCTLVPAE